MDEATKQAIMRRYNEGMCAMTDAQMAVRAAEQAAGMRNIAQMQQNSGDDLRNMWASMDDIAPAQLPPLTRRQRITQWLSRFWSRT